VSKLVTRRSPFASAAKYTSKTNAPKGSLQATVTIDLGNNAYPQQKSRETPQTAISSMSRPAASKLPCRWW